MDAAKTLYNNGSILRSINRVRILHGIYHLSDITTANGISLDDSFLKSVPFKGVRNNHKWPIKHHVTTLDFSRWRKFVQIVYSADSLQLPTTLKNWTFSQSIYSKNWDWFVTENREFLYHNIHHEWQRHLLIPSSHRRYHIEYLPMQTRPTCRLLPASTIISDRSINLRNFCSLPPSLPQHDDMIAIGPFTFRDNFQQCYFDNISHSDSLLSLHHHINTGTAISVSDGTFFPSHQIGAFAWIVSTPDLKEWIQGSSIVPGNRSIHSAFRAELCGLAGIAFFFNTINLNVENSHHQSVFCDCKSALKRIVTSREYLKSSIKHMDVISIIIDLWETSTFSLFPSTSKPTKMTTNSTTSPLMLN